MSELVLVVSGPPRSGTSLAMALLRAGGVELLEDEARPPDPDNPLGYHEYEPVKRLPRQPDWLGAAQGRAVKVVHALLPSLPEGPRYRVILMHRDLHEVVASQDRMLARRRAGSGRLSRERLVELLALQLEEVRVWLRARPRIAWMELDYNALVRDPLPGLASLAAFAGLRAEPAVLAGVVRPELHRVRRAGAQGAEPAARAAGPSK